MSQGYDHTFAQAAPAATKSQIQEGYDVNLLRATHPAAPPPKMEYNSFDAEGRGTVPPPRAIPWWQTKKGIAIIAVAVVVVLAAVIGGAVGGTAGKKSNNGALELPQNNQTSTSTPSNTASASAHAHETVEVLTTTLYNDQGVNFTALTLSATIEMFQTDNPVESLHVPHPLTTTLVFVEQVPGDPNPNQSQNETVTTIITAFFPAVTEGTKAIAGITSALSGKGGNPTKGNGGNSASPTSSPPEATPVSTSPACPQGQDNCQNPVDPFSRSSDGPATTPQ